MFLAQISGTGGRKRRAFNDDSGAMDIASISVRLARLYAPSCRADGAGMLISLGFAVVSRSLTQSEISLRNC
jgi:hypothetical protein